MGQYYYPILTDQQTETVIASFYSHSFDHNGLKLTEHSYLGNLFVESVVAKAMAQKKPVTLIWLGDYADYDEDLAARDDACKGAFRLAQRAVNDDSTLVGPDDDGILANLDAAPSAVIYNIAANQKLSIRRYREHVISERLARGYKPRWSDETEADFILHPLPLLTAVGNGKGGGDYEGTHMDLIGTWALRPLVILPEGEIPDDGQWEDVSESFAFEEGD